MNRQPDIRVLFVEPNPVVGRSVKLYVQGFAGRAIDLQTACNMDELQTRAREQWDVVLINDGNLKNGSAELIEQGNRLFSSVPRISVGAHTDSLMTTCSETSIDDFFPRIQVNPAALLRSVNNLIERRRLEDGLEEQQAQMNEASSLDSISGTWGDVYLKQRLEEAFNAAKRYKHDLTICHLEIYEAEPLGLKYGNEVLEMVLKGVGGILKNSMRTTDFVGRVGTARFCVAWTFTPLAGAMIALERIKSKIEGKLYSTLSNENFTIDACYGVVPLSEEYLSYDDYIHASEKALRKSLRTAPSHIEVPDPLDF